MKILLIAGHGNGDSGATAFGRSEAELTRSLVPKIKESLSRFNCVCDIFDMSKSAYNELVTRGNKINFTPYDYVLEVHFNAFSENSDGKVMGCEVYVTREEQNIAVEQAMVRNIASLGLKNRGVKRMNFTVIAEARRQGASSALLETCFIDDADDMKIYLVNENKIADAVADAIAEGYRLSLKEGTMFSDITNHWARDAIEKMAELDVVDGYADGTYRPGNPLTRAEAAVMLSRLYDLLK